MKPRTFALAIVLVIIFCDGILVPLLPRKRCVRVEQSVEIELPDIHFIPKKKGALYGHHWQNI